MKKTAEDSDKNSGIVMKQMKELFWLSKFFKSDCRFFSGIKYKNSRKTTSFFI